MDQSQNLSSKTLLESKEAKQNPKDPFSKINFFSRILFFWVFSLIKNAQKRSLEQEDIFQLNKKDQSQYNFEKFDKIYEELINNPKVKNKIKTTFYRIYKKEIIISAILYFLYLMSNVFKMMSFQLILDAFDDPLRGKSFSPMIFGMVLLASSFILQSIIYSNYKFYYSQLTVRMTGALSIKIFKKTFCFAMQRNQLYKVGDILNMIQVDILQIVSYVQSVFTLAFSFLLILVSFYLCYKQLNNVKIILVMAVCVLIASTISLVFGKWYGNIQKKFMHQKDLRMRSLEEMMRGIKTIKYNCLESFFDERIMHKREKEIKELKLQNVLSSLNEFISNFSCTVAIFIVTLIFGISSLSQFLMINSSYNIILNFLISVPSSIQGIVVGSNSMKRIDIFLTESFVYQQCINSNDQQNAISLINSNFSWKNSLDINQIEESVQLSKRERQSFSQQSQSNLFEIKNLSLTIKKGEYVVFYGDLGSGKTSILQGILGEMEVNGGQIMYEQMVQINGQISICSQEPWIIQDTVKENIVFGQIFDKDRYKQVLKVCSLEEDISYFIDGDQTNIGEKGDTLSGGQRKRVNLARSIYKEADIYFLDDPLSALDIGVSTQIAKECFEGMLKDKTRVIFTNSLTGMNKADRIFVVKNGQIVNEGNYNQIKKIIAQANNNSQYDLEQDMHDEEKERAQSIKILKSQRKEQNNENNYTKKLIQSEDIQQGNFKLEILKEFFKSVGGTPFIIISIILIAAYTVAGVFSKLIQLDVSKDAPKDQQFKVMMGYCALNALCLLLVMAFELYIVIKMANLSKQLHKSIVFELLRASFTKFYNLITSGRIMNRLSKDIYQVDMQVTQDMSSNYYNIGGLFFSIITTFIICNISTIPIGICYIFLAVFIAFIFLKAKRQLARIEATSKSPILQYFSEIIRGIFYVRYCVCYQKMKNTFQEYVDIDLRNQIALNGVEFWFECISNFLNMFPVLISVAIVYYDMSVSANNAVLMAVQVSGIAISLVYFTKSWISYETHLVNYERCLKLKESIIPEDYELQIQTINSQIQQNNQSNNSNYKQPDIESNQRSYNSQFESEYDCFYQQQIVFKNASFQYREDLPNCLQNLSIKFSGNEKIGVVGRTGAGKTSITLALTKVLDLVEGDVLINGKSISEYPLKNLRKSIISVVSQEPYIYEGSLKQNLDPYNQYTENQIIDAFKKCGFSTFRSFKDGLKTQISQLGDNLSEGEKQLISICRIILKKSKIIIVDEPTSHIDASMEDHVTKVLNDCFQDCLMITIAHKIKTIMNSDKILVLDHGQVKEFDSPQTLLQNKQSLFSGILNKINQNGIN
ncbi:ABC transporter C family protein (macronuclear) [Tetrahymena thermophila SB210]|uniref:ABC transporter C family protein n=1 Tax=Tetrahymena thermophila (strain SB210) TaxID=312017 RepID=Q23TU7_TETTS|nr:ABC transporter C family protein [Tetrahymena thermophila SB210]EAR99948.2 ABC transporter C family protein [Tetrahymena thermophila SB210]|eukprot:XP_001020193.2 ABC transporter C family protein [Tetrahymena thermophila SB210]